MKLDASKTELKDLKQRLEKSNEKLKVSESKNKQLESKMTSSADSLSTVRTIFKDMETFPVIQTNGHLVAFHTVMEIWCKKADEDENHSLRTYICPFTNTHTNLTQFPVISHTQKIASALGFSVEPPVMFDVEKTRTEFSLKTQIQLSARICYLYANRKKYGESGKTSSVAADSENMIIVFKVAKVNTALFHLKIYSNILKNTQNDSSYVLHCSTNIKGVEHAIYLRTMKPFWNPFENIKFADSPLI